MLQLVTPNFSDLLVPNVEIGKFPDGDSHVRIPNLEFYAGQEVLLFHRLYPNQNDNFTELLLVLQTLKEQQARVTAVVPYLPYARQDKKTLDGEVQSAHIVCNLLFHAGCQRLITFDCHFLNQEGDAVFGGLAIRNFSMNEALVSYAQKLFSGETFEVAGPDAGSAYLVQKWGGKTMKKVRRAYKDGVVGYRDVESLECDFDMKDKNILILDDMISTGQTMLSAIAKAKACGAKKVGCATTHGLFLYNTLDKLRKTADFVFSADTIASPQAEVSIKEKILELQSPEQKLF